MKGWQRFCVTELFEESKVSTDAKGTKILARTFFQQLRASGYTPHQIIGVATELIDLVTTELRGAEAASLAAAQKQMESVRPEV